MNKHVSVELKNELSELARLGEIIEGLPQQAPIDPQAVFHLQLACDELLTNTISYGYADGASRTIAVSFTLRDGEVEVCIADDAAPFNPLDRPEPDVSLGLEERKAGGLGIHFVRQVMDEVRYAHVDGRNVIRLIKKTKPLTEGSI